VVARDRARVLVLDLEASGLDAQESNLINGLVTQSVSRFPQYQVISSGDVRQLVNLDADKRLLGCDQTSCLAEVAGALGARWVVFGNVGRLGRATVLTLSLFDNGKAVAVARQRIEVEALEALPTRIDGAISALLGEPTAASVAQASPGPSGWFVGGLVTAGVAGAATIVGGVVVLVLDDGLSHAATSRAQKQFTLQAGPWLMAGPGAAGLVTLMGAGVALAAGVAE
jgi:hypothetical protein